MNEVNKTRSEIIEKLRAQAYEVLDTPADHIPAAAPLIEAQEYLEEILPDCDDPDVRFAAFFLFNFLDDIFYNLTGDVPYSEELDITRGSFFRTFSQLLLSISEALAIEDYNKCYEAYKSAVAVYLDTINRLNQTLE